MGHRFSKEQRVQHLRHNPEDNHPTLSLATGIRQSTNDYPQMLPDHQIASRAYKSVVIKICMLKVEEPTNSMVSTDPAECNGCHSNHTKANDPTPHNLHQHTPCSAVSSIAGTIPIVQMSDITGEPSDDMHNANVHSSCIVDRIRPGDVANNNHEDEQLFGQVPPIVDKHSAWETSHQGTPVETFPYVHRSTFATTVSPTSPPLVKQSLCDNHNINQHTPDKRSGHSVSSLPFGMVGISETTNYKKTSLSSLDPPPASTKEESGNRAVSPRQCESVQQLCAMQVQPRGAVATRLVGASAVTTASATIMASIGGSQVTDLRPLIEKLEINESDGKYCWTCIAHQNIFSVNYLVGSANLLYSNTRRSHKSVLLIRWLGRLQAYGIK